MSETVSSLTEKDIRSLASSQSFERGTTYFHSGALFNTRRVGKELRAHCQGSSYAPYRVSAELSSGGITAAYYNCQYDWGGICKHLVALLLAWVHTPELFQSVAPSSERLANKTKEELITLIQEIFKREPDLERLLDLPLHPDPNSPLELDAFRRQIDFILQSEFPDLEELFFEITAIAETADRFAAGGNWSAAGAVYHLILSTIVPSYDGQLYDEDGDIARVLQMCVVGIETCLAKVKSDTATRRLWFDVLLDAKLMHIQMGGIDLAYSAGDMLVEHATDEEWTRIEERVRQWMDAPEDQLSRWGWEALVDFLVQRMMRTGREAEVTDLIFELGSAEQQAFELVRLGRLDEGISIAREHFTNFPGLVLRFADALVEAEGISAAVGFISSQLETRSRASYLSWLAQLAENQQDIETTLHWRLELFRESPSLENYRNLREAAQRLNQWEQFNPGLIQKLETDQHWDLLIEIALEDGDVTRALELLPRQRWGRHNLQVARAAETTHPKAAIKIYNQRIERLIDARGRSNYQEAAAILQRVMRLYHQRGAQKEWNYYMAELRERHARLPALMDELNKAGL